MSVPVLQHPQLPGGASGAETSDDSGFDVVMDDSLTDMRWLQRMDAGRQIHIKIIGTFPYKDTYTFSHRTFINLV